MGGDKVEVRAVGTIRWTVDNDDGEPHLFVIPGSLLYIPDSPARLFLPQHWAQERKDNTPTINGTWHATFADHVTHVWGQQKYRKRIPFDNSNVAAITTSAGSKNFRVFRACLEATGKEEETTGGYTAFDANLIVDDEDNYPQNGESADEGNSSFDDASLTPMIQPSDTIDQRQHEDDTDPGYSMTTGNHETSCDRYAALIEEVSKDEFDGKLKPTSERMLWHCRLGHVPFSRLQQMAKNGQLPKRLSECREPKCPAYIYGKMTRRAKRTKKKASKVEARTITGPGACV
jgi:hypothetical protein